MRKLLALLMVVLLGAAFAQRPYFGASTTAGGFVFLPDFSMLINVQAGIKEAVGPLGFRGNVTVGLANQAQASGFGIGADALFPIVNGMNSFYVGAGASYYTGSIGSTISINARAFTLQGIIGYEAMIARNWSVLVELVPNYNFDSREFGLRLGFGTNIYF